MTWRTDWPAFRIVSRRTVRVPWGVSSVILISVSDSSVPDVAREGGGPEVAREGGGPHAVAWIARVAVVCDELVLVIAILFGLQVMLVTLHLVMIPWPVEPGSQLLDQLPHVAVFREDMGNIGAGVDD